MDRVGKGKELEMGRVYGVLVIEDREGFWTRWNQTDSKPK